VAILFVCYIYDQKWQEIKNNRPGNCEEYSTCIFWSRTFINVAIAYGITGIALFIPAQISQTLRCERKLTQTEITLSSPAVILDKAIGSWYVTE